MYKFAPASANEPIVFGSARPGYRDEQIAEWIQFMQNQGIQRVCCLLSEAQLRRYESNLLTTYQHTFGQSHICWAPIEDFHLITPKAFTHQILPFLTLADQNQEKVVVHCSGGIGRTGHVLAAWLVARRGLSNRTAITAVQQTGKNPYEAVIAAPFKGRAPWKVAAELQILLDECRQLTANS